MIIHYHGRKVAISSHGASHPRLLDLITRPQLPGNIQTLKQVISSRDKVITRVIPGIHLAMLGATLEIYHVKTFLGYIFGVYCWGVTGNFKSAPGAEVFHVNCTTTGQVPLTKRTTQMLSYSLNWHFIVAAEKYIVHEINIPLCVICHHNIRYCAV
jgi:hypothetical protein